MRAVSWRVSLGIVVLALGWGAVIAGCASFSGGERSEVAATEPADSGRPAIAPPDRAAMCADVPKRATAYVERRLPEVVLGPRRDSANASLSSLVGAYGGRAYVVVAQGSDTLLRTWGESIFDASQPVLVPRAGAGLHFRVDARGGITAYDASTFDRVSPSGDRTPLVQFAVSGSANRATTGASLAFVTALSAPEGGPTEIRAYPLSASSKASDKPTFVVSDAASPRVLVAVGDRPVWLAETAPGTYVVKTVSDGAVAQVSSPLAVDALAADSEYAFGLTTDGQSSTLVRASLEGEGDDDLVLIGSPTSQRAIAVAGDYVYFTANWGKVALFRVPRCGGTVERLAVLDSASGPIFIADKLLYVENADEIRRYELP